MNSLGLLGVLFFLQTPAEMERAMAEMEVIDCQKMFDSMSSQCFNQCKTMNEKSGSKEQSASCSNQCQNMMSEMLTKCKQIKKRVSDFKKKSPEEQERILQEAAKESSQSHH